MTLEYEFDRIPPLTWPKALDICAGDAEWWYVEECEVSNTSERKDDELNVSQKEYYNRFSNQIVEIRRDEFSWFLDVLVPFRRKDRVAIVDHKPVAKDSRLLRQGFGTKTTDAG